MPSLSGWKRSARELISGPTRNGAAEATTTTTTNNDKATAATTRPRTRDRKQNRQSAGVLLKDLIRKAKHPQQNTTPTSSAPSEDTAPTSSIAEGASKAATKSVSATSDPVLSPTEYLGSAAGHLRARLAQLVAPTPVRGQAVARLIISNDLLPEKTQLAFFVFSLNWLSLFSLFPFLHCLLPKWGRGCLVLQAQLELLSQIRQLSIARVCYILGGSTFTFWVWNDLFSRGLGSYLSP